jgi:uncharacterized protein YbjT (DUF2867 family)
MEKNAREVITVAVCGATGKQGGAVIDQILICNRRSKKTGCIYKIRALTRNPGSSSAQSLKAKDPASIELITCELSSFDSIVDALSGCDICFGLTNYWDPATKGVPGLEERQGRYLVDAVRLR